MEKSQIEPRRYEVRQDGMVIVTLEDKEGISPVYAITLMAQKLSEQRERMLAQDYEPRA